MPILAFAPSLDDLEPSLRSLGRRTLIQVSAQARRVLEAMVSQDDRCCTAEHVAILRGLAEQRESDSELQLLLRAIERSGQVYVRFL